MTFEKNDIVRVRQGDVPAFFACPAQEKADKEFEETNGNEWLVIERSADGWWGDPPWRIESLKSGHIIERFDEDLTLIRKQDAPEHKAEGI